MAFLETCPHVNGDVFIVKTLVKDETHEALQRALLRFAV